jgi:O-antigen/teichoic acid export membrane protein
VALPLLSNTAITRTDFIRLVRILVIGSILFGIAMIGGIVLVGQRVLDSFTGAEYAETYTYLLLLSPLPLLKACNLVAAAIILSRDAVRMRVVAQGLAVISCIVLNYLLTPRLGIYGATYAVLATEMIILVLYISMAFITYRRSTFGTQA